MRFRSLSIPRVLANPFATAILSGFLVTSAVHVVRNLRPGDRSVVLSRFSAQPRYPFQGISGEVWAVFFVKDEGSIRIRVNNESRLSLERLNRAQIGVIAYDPPQPRRRGAWAVTQVEEPHTLRASFGSDFTPADRAEARRQAVDSLASAPGSVLIPQSVAARLRTEDFTISTPIPAGHIHNSCVAVAFCALLASLAWLPRAHEYVPLNRAARRLRRGLCPSCAYSMAGLPAGRCPECGSPTSRPAPHAP